MIYNQNINTLIKRQRVLLVSDTFNAKYNGFVIKALDNHTVFAAKTFTDFLTPYEKLVTDNHCTVVAFNNERLLRKLVDLYVDLAGKIQVNCNVFAGSVFKHKGVKWVCIPSGKQLAMDKGLQFLVSRYIDKIGIGWEEPSLQWEHLTQNNADKYYSLFQQAKMIAVDIETTKKEVNVTALRQHYPMEADGIWCKTKKSKTSKLLIEAVPAISMVGYSGLFVDVNGKLNSFTVVLSIKSMEDIYLMRKFNRLTAPKVMFNGAYDSSYFIRFNAPLYNYVYDGFQMLHAWLAELPRKLADMASMFLTNYVYWKGESDFNIEEYNAKDCHNTLWGFLFMVQCIPDWAKDNYYHKFRMIFPNLTGGLDGFKIDWDENSRLREHYWEQYEGAKQYMENAILEGFNCNSSTQVVSLMNALSIFAKVKKYDSSDKKDMQHFAEAHPLNEFIISKIKEVREADKKLSTYINIADFNGRLLYEVNSSGTDTGRAASKASNFWCGTQVQNMDNKLRSQFVADDGWELGNCDGSQAESRTTAYLSEDETLIDNVEHAPDFHKRNASMFFGFPENEITKAIRTLSKRVNHGANYNMGERVLLDTMGTKAVLEAKAILKLPKRFGVLDVCRYLLERFEHTYPTLKGAYYEKIIDTVNITHMLVAPRTRLCSWTRYCFNYPISRTANKLGLNSYVAHPSQNLSAMILDEAAFDAWYELQIKRNIMRYRAQIHDEIVYQVRPENHDLVKDRVSELMARSVEVNGRTLRIPNDRGGKGYRWSDLKD